MGEGARALQGSSVSMVVPWCLLVWGLRGRYICVPSRELTWCRWWWR